MRQPRQSSVPSVPRRCQAPTPDQFRGVGAAGKLQWHTYGQQLKSTGRRPSTSNETRKRQSSLPASPAYGWEYHISIPKYSSTLGDVVLYLPLSCIWLHPRVLRSNCCFLGTKVTSVHVM